MTVEEKALAYNLKIHDALALLYGELNQGQRKKVLKNDEVKKLLERYKVIDAEEGAA